jgi:ATP-dependent helicase/nuclease subunit B
MARAGAFEGIGEAVTTELAYWRLRGGRDVANVVAVEVDPMILAAAALARLKQLIAEFEDPAMPYLPVPDPDFLPAAGPYDHLSRRGEWTVGPL